MEKALEIFAWPLAAVICILGFSLIFRRPVATLIDRARRFGFGDKSIDLTGDVPAAEQQKKLEATAADATLGMVPATHAMPPYSELCADIEQEIKNTLATANYPPDLEKAWLIRTIATLRIARGHEITYRLIVGSQIALLLQANTASPPDMEKAREIYEGAKTQYPDIYTKS